MSFDKKIFFIGAGNMGGAILCALIDSGYPERTIFFYEPNEDQACEIAEKSKAIRVASLSEGFSEADVVFLCLKPQIFSNISTLLNAELKKTDKRPIIISIMAGVKIATLHEIFQENAIIVRTMPNIAITVKKGIVAVATDNVKESVLQTVESLFSTCANTIKILENQMDAVTGLSGSGPAFVFQFIEALAMGGVKMGLKRDVAMELALATAAGSIEMLLKLNLCSNELTANACSPAGTTIAGLQELENKAFRGIVMAAVEAAVNRSVELGKS
ncbi:MAG: pyrroline-5-carboxylate reductase [Fibromonadaceae bacterium]|jgi:pyrroline-5-carboxylate reductase|nr:pyrroline-5-carboxylate reductase [Fibromonadaceae bacterium]